VSFQAAVSESSWPSALLQVKGMRLPASALLAASQNVFLQQLLLQRAETSLKKSIA